MRPPLWIVNSVLLTLLILCLCLMLVCQPNIPQAASLLPKNSRVTSANITPVNLKSIYEDDIFKTHISNTDAIFEAEKNLQIPTPPTYQAPVLEQLSAPVFLEPLPITVTGIMTFGSEEFNRVILRDQRDQTERAYTIGDDLEDAQILRILPNKILIIRANSQQETLFLREQDVISDLDLIEPDWSLFIKPVEPNLYQINGPELGQAVKNLGNLIDLLNLITAYKAGISIGVKIGSNTNSMLVSKLGLSSGDLLLSVNDITLDNTNNRLNAYNLITKNQVSEIVLKLIRNQQDLKITYQVKYTKDHEALVANNAASVQAHVAKKHAKLEDTYDKIQAQDRNHITQFKNKISQSVLG